MEDITGCYKEVAKGANKAPRIAPSCCFISFFTVPVTPSVNTTESSNKFIILIVSVLSSLQINKVNPFPALAAPFLFIFTANLFILLEVKLLNCLLIQVNCL